MSTDSTPPSFPGNDSLDDRIPRINNTSPSNDRVTLFFNIHKERLDHHKLGSFFSQAENHVRRDIDRGLGRSPLPDGAYLLKYHEVDLRVYDTPSQLMRIRDIPQVLAKTKAFENRLYRTLDFDVSSSQVGRTGFGSLRNSSKQITPGDGMTTTPKVVEIS